MCSSCKRVVFRTLIRKVGRSTPIWHNLIPHRFSLRFRGNVPVHVCCQRLGPPSRRGKPTRPRVPASEKILLPLLPGPGAALAGAGRLLARGCCFLSLCSAPFALLPTKCGTPRPRIPGSLLFSSSTTSCSTLSCPCFRSRLHPDSSSPELSHRSIHSLYLYFSKSPPTQHVQKTRLPSTTWILSLSNHHPKSEWLHRLFRCIGQKSQGHSWHQPSLIPHVPTSPVDFTS